MKTIQLRQYFILAITLLYGSFPAIASDTTTIMLGSFGGRPTTDISINGSRPFPVILDTGFAGGSLMLDIDKAKELNLRKKGEREFQNMGRGKVMKMTSWESETAILGNFQVNLEHISSHNKSRQRKASDPRGVMSIWALSKGTISIDLQNRLIRLSNNEPLDAAMENTLSISKSEMPLPGFEVTLNNKSYLAHIDTGSPAGLSLPLSMKEEFEFISEPKIVGKARIPGNHADIWQAKIKGDLIIGDIVIKQPTVNFLAPLKWVNIGSDILKNYQVSIDQKNNYIQFKAI